MSARMSAQSAAVEPVPRAGRLTVLVPCDVALDTAAEVGRAIRRAAPLLRGERVVVVATWRSIAPAAGLARAALPAAMVAAGVRNRDEDQHDRARRCAQEVVAIAQECGVDAVDETRMVAGAWATSVAAIAEEIGAGAILLAGAQRARGLARRLARRRRPDGAAPPPLVVA